MNNWEMQVLTKDGQILTRYLSGADNESYDEVCNKADRICETSGYKLVGVTQAREIPKLKKLTHWTESVFFQILTIIIVFGVAILAILAIYMLGVVSNFLASYYG